MRNKKKGSRDVWEKKEGKALLGGRKEESYIQVPMLGGKKFLREAKPKIK